MRNELGCSQVHESQNFKNYVHLSQSIQIITGPDGNIKEIKFKHALQLLTQYMKNKH